MRAARPWLGTLAGLLFATSAVAASHRIVSTNLCTDQIVLMLANPDDIVGLSPLARNCQESVLCQQARRVPSLRSTAEAVLAARPDIVLASTYASAGVQIGQQAGLHVVGLPPVEQIDDIPVQIMQIADAIGRPDRGRALVSAFRARLAVLERQRPTTKSPSAIVYAAHGFVTRRGSLADDLLTRAGWRNLADSPAYRSGLGVPLEQLIAHPPEMLVLDRDTEGESLAQATLDNAALRAAFPPSRRLDVPSRLWLCGLPQTLDVLAMLISARQGAGRP
ncbi:ferrichrome ABC transporter substrate-binding protein [Neoasaia chiangmaiensis NBRC 101099]|uniref:Uncharacterized protein n=1 Tax=Neoasaia chiangmaiensis TaxID=320497 RepID=A0A1U9KNE5_9PROT|nr:ABC transporter substrate-binding protein [Neoasaia chiangmaiensis]AQS87305.1 hypothetical protein A0U93_04410 [Neoasaia chiangmaiensis]GBR38612.1 ferrichrome ABC transporter substrate-binding protein [Neoasaia chiangmaiensis NBRC 101099]GEN15817.1 cobalamin ABC transporter substrate-binding protein [Neoasaia chiangmaiensis]